MARKILVRKVDGAWVVGREGHDFQRFGSKAGAMQRATALIDRIGDAELVIEEGTGVAAESPPRGGGTGPAKKASR